MANAFYRLRKSKSKKPEIIYLGFRFGNDQLIYSTGIKILPKYWDFTKSRVKNVVDVWNKDDINTFLVELAEFVNSVSNSYKAKKEELTKLVLKIEIDNYINPPQTPEKISFYQFMDQYVEDLRTGKRLVRGNRIADKKTVQRYITAKNRLVAFGEYLGNEITFDLWSEELWRDFIRYLTFEMKYKVNNIGFLQKQTLLYLKAAKKTKLIDDDWMDDVGIMSEEPDDVALYKDELELLEFYNFSNNERYDKVRDLGLAGCFTGFRVSDWAQIHKDNFKITREGNKYIEIMPEKEGATPPSTPLHPTVERILDKYNGHLPIMAEQTFNRLFKEVCKIAGINEKSKIKYQKEGKVIVETVEKWSQVSSHTCRRSFATNMYLDKVDPRLIMKTTGHTSEKNFLKYLKLNSSNSIDAIAEYKKRNL